MEINKYVIQKVYKWGDICAVEILLFTKKYFNVSNKYKLV